MPIMNTQLTKILEDFKSELSAAKTVAEVMVVKSRYLGNKGAVSTIMKSLGDISPEERKKLGAETNACKGQIQEMVEAKQSEIENAEAQAALNREWVDPTLRESVIDSGLSAAGYHPTNIVQREIEEIFASMGFEILDGPHIETEYYNFVALNIPGDHPARDMQDTFWFPDCQHLLRTQTSAVQARGLETHKPPFKFIAPGKCFRCERTDASHEMVFHQLEGMMVGEEVSVAHLIFFMKTLLSEVFRRDVEVRLRPGFFPFVEPGFELDIKCLICGGKGCSVCKQSGWVELLPCGMVHPAVLRMGGVDPDKYSGFAFGLGLDRLVMMRYGITDIRLIHSGDLRFSSQFKSF